MKRIVVLVGAIGASILLAGCGGGGDDSTLDVNSDAGAAEARQACTAWALGKTQTIDGVRVSFKEAAEAAGRASSSNPSRWGSLASDLQELYPLAIDPSSGSTDRLLELTDKIDVACVGYESWPEPTADGGDPTVESAPSVAADDAPAVEGDHTAAADVIELSVDDLLLAQVSKDQLDFVNGKGFESYITAEKDSILEPGDEGWGAGDEWKITPKKCADLVAPLGYISPGVMEALEPRAEARMMRMRDVIGDAPGNLLIWATRAILASPNAASSLVESVAAGLPGCAGGKYSSGGETSPIDPTIIRSGAALVTTSDPQSGVVNVLEPIGSVLYSLTIAGEGAALKRGFEVYNELADALAQAQGLSREPVSMVLNRGSDTSSNGTSDLPPGITQEVADSVFGVLKDDLDTTCSNFETFGDSYVESIAATASQGGGSAEDWSALLDEWLKRSC